MHVRGCTEFDGGEDTVAGSVTPAFRHDALLYDTPEQLAAVAGPFLLEGLAPGTAR